MYERKDNFQIKRVHTKCVCKRKITPKSIIRIHAHESTKEKITPKIYYNRFSFIKEKITLSVDFSWAKRT